jgi:hypothetical protein
VKTEKPTLRHILSVRCPMCHAKPKEQCTLTTGQPCVKTHLARKLAAAVAPVPESLARAAMRVARQVTSSSFRALFQHK